jgi:RimJ/RimL family protein N-acetyltransferase
VRELIDVIFTGTDVRRIVASVDERNTRAHRLLMRTGFRKADTASGWFRGQPCIEHVWELFRPPPSTTRARD